MLHSAESDVFLYIRKDKGISGDLETCKYDDKGKGRRNFNEGRTEEVNESICSIL